MAERRFRIGGRRKRGYGRPLAFERLEDRLALSAATLYPVADSYTRPGANAGVDDVLEVHDFGGGDYMAYLQFDLSGLNIQAITDATLTLHKVAGIRNDTIVADRFDNYGLTSAPGSTPQNWNELTLADGGLGAEYTNTGGNLLDTSLVFNLNAESGANVSEFVDNSITPQILTGPDLVTFLNQRLADGGLATIISLVDAGQVRGWGYASREHADLGLRPTLQIEFTEGEPEPEPDPTPLPARQMEHLNRGIVAVRTGTTSAYIGWRLLGTDPDDIAFDLYRSSDGGPAVKLNATPITQTTNFVDGASTGLNFNVSNRYFVVPIVSGIEQGASESFTMPASVPIRQYLSVPLQRPAGGVVTPPPGTVTPIPEPPQGGAAPLDYTYNANDASVGDLDGDGEYEIVLKWDPTNSRDNAHEGFTGPVIIDAYKLDGTLLWRINLGRNIRAGAHYTQFLVYDFDGDGRAEVVMKTADGTVDGTGQVLGNPDADYRDPYAGGSDGRWGRVLAGPEYLTVFDGLTGKALSTVAFSPPRGSVSSWGDSYGNRVDRFLATVAYLDGERPSIVMARGYYAKTRLTAYDWRDGQLTQRWAFDSTTPGNSIYGGQGNHNLSVADVDGDGKDEIIYGAAAFDDDGTGLYSTGLGHGDALHVSDMDPTRPGLEVFQPHESPSAYGPNALSLIDAATGQLLLGVSASGDIGRGLALDVDPRYPGYEMWGSGGTGGMYTATLTTPDAVNGPRGVQIASNKPSINFGIWWDADLLRELLDGTTVSKWNWPSGSGNGGTTTLLSPSGVSSNNGSKATPVISADLLGDWREEVIWRNSANTELRIYTTTIPATNRIYTLMHDSQYRAAIAWQNVAYNQPPHPSFFLGDGMGPPPAPRIYTVQYVAPLPGDFNGDRRVDGGDYVIWRNHLGDPDESALNGAGNGVGGVDFDDYLWWKQHYGMNGDQNTGGGGFVVNTLDPGAGTAGDTSEHNPVGALSAWPSRGLTTFASPLVADQPISNVPSSPAEPFSQDLLVLLLDPRPDDESAAAMDPAADPTTYEPPADDLLNGRDEAWADFGRLSVVRPWRTP